MNKVYEYVKENEKASEVNFEATHISMFNDQATAYWAVRQFMEVNDLTERLYTKEDMRSAMALGMITRQDQLLSSSPVDGTKAFEGLITELNK